jgi:hypothetical protein
VNTDQNLDPFYAKNDENHQWNPEVLGENPGDAPSFDINGYPIDPYNSGFYNDSGAYRPCPAPHTSAQLLPGQSQGIDSTVWGEMGALKRPTHQHLLADDR